MRKFIATLVLVSIPLPAFASYTGTSFVTGVPGYSDTGTLGQLTGNANAYEQLIIQNTNAGTAASADVILSNNLGTATTYYGDFGINSSAYTGSGAYNLPNAVYISSSNGDLVLGTITNNAVHFFLNNGTTDAAILNTQGSFVVLGGTCVGTGDGACSAYSSSLASFGGGSADATQIAAAGVQTFLFDQYGRYRPAQLNGVPTITSGNCGAATNGTITAGGTDQDFYLNIGSAATASCIVNFSVAWTTAPRLCDPIPANAASAAATVLAYTNAPNATTWTLSGAVLANTAWAVHCE